MSSLKMPDVLPRRSGIAGARLRRIARNFVICEKTARDGVSREFVAAAVARWGSTCPADVLEWAAAYVATQAAAAGQLAQRDRPARTDCDRLDRAFAALEASGVLARQDFSCCMTCGSYQLWQEMKAVPPTRAVRGYVFYHEQDTDSAAAGGLCLRYGSADGTNESTQALGRHIVAALRAEGLRTEWNGCTDKCIVVQLAWKRR